ncbi:MAG: hypothetical protein IKG82_12160 [Oscillospiraceae bacterium]|nr:hypothetical protein [Oscillospiraceae bacterium]
MKARIEQHRIGFRMIFLLIVQTVCLAALPAGTVTVQQITGTVVCTELSESPAASQEQSANIRQQHQNYLPVLAAAAVVLTSCVVCALPADRTPVRNKVRMDD